MGTRSALVNGAGGFIGSHLVKRLKREGYRVRGVDLKRPEFSASEADEFIVGDLREPEVVKAAVDGVDEVYQLSLIHISEPTRPPLLSRMPSSA